MKRGHPRRSAIELGDEPWGLDLEQQQERERATISLSDSWLECPLDSQGVPAGVGGWDKATNRGRKVRSRSVRSAG